MIVDWIDPTESIRTQDYWNDASQEEGKVFNVKDGNFNSLEESEHLNAIHHHLLQISDGIPWSGHVLSLGAGTGWLEARCLHEADFERLTLVDFSHHRIHDLAPLTIRHYGLDLDKVDFVRGNILNLQLEDHSVDRILLSQAFHHVDQPVALLHEMKRVLKPDGVVFIVGEHFYRWRIRLNRRSRHIVKWLINYQGFRSGNPLWPTYEILFPPCPVKGDFHYTLDQYRAMFSEAGFSFTHSVDTTRTIQGFILRTA